MSVIPVDRPQSCKEKGSARQVEYTPRSRGVSVNCHERVAVPRMRLRKRPCCNSSNERLQPTCRILFWRGSGESAAARAPTRFTGVAPSAWSTERGVRIGVVFAGLALLINLPPMVTLPHDHGPRVFTPTWLLLSAAAAVVGPRLALRRLRLVGAFAGLFAAGALLSLALSVSARVETADFTERSSRWFAARVPDGGRVVVCDVPRTVATLAPNGPFALHELHETWSAEAAVNYYTGKKIRIERTGIYWSADCNDLRPADLVVGFDELRQQTLH